MKKTMCLALLAAALISTSSYAGAIKTGGGQQILQDSLDTAGGVATAGTGKLYSSIGQQSAPAISMSGSYTLYSGFLSVVDETPPTVAFTSPAASSAQTGTIGIVGTATDINGVQWTLYYGPGAAPTAWKQITTGASGISAASLASWDSTGRKGTYTLKIVAVDGRGNTATGTVTFNIGNTYTISGTIPQFKWIFLSTPVQPDPSDPVSMFGSNYQYKVYRWNPEKDPVQDLGRYEYPAIVSAGLGYWVQAFYQPMPYSYTGIVADTTTDYVLPVKSGWNQIGTPFNREFPWGQVRIRDGASIYDLNAAANLGLIASTLISYDSDARSWVQNDSSAMMQPQMGYGVRAYKNIDLLLNPGSGMSGGLARIVRAPFDFKLKISAQAGGAADLYNYMGMVRTANAEYDAFDLEEPMRNPENKYVTVYFPHENWRLNAGRYANDVRTTAASIGAVESWMFNVDTNEFGKTVTLTWDNATLPADRYSFTLVNLVTGERVDMVERGNYSYVADGGDVSTGRFKTEVVKLSGKLVSKSFTLNPGWNLISPPVDPETTSAQAQLGDDLARLEVFQNDGGKYLSPENSDIQAGLGYWVYGGDNTQIDIEGIRVTGEIRVPLSAGWNAIGNPFESEVPWGDNMVFECDGAKQPLSQAVGSAVTNGNLYEYDGTKYVASKVLKPWKGYFVKCTRACELVFSE